ncbi:PTPLA-domain-containing protein [Gautieria morchelliformis]|nr:PTPLA-domain-containing protein [Gautieria morchelliformis]
MTHNEKSKRSGSGSTAVRRYLVAYNVLSALGWSYVFFMASKHLSGLTHQYRAVTPSASPVATSGLKRILGSIPYIKTSAPVTTQTPSQIPPMLLPVFDRAKSTFAAVGWQTAVVQSFAALEVVHSLLGWVRSPVLTTAMQVASRLILVWGIAERFEAARVNPIYTSMILAWSITEIIRYFFYAANRLQLEPRWLLWLRYNTFYVLYPLGAGSEAALIFSTLPSHRAWDTWDYGRAVMFLIWWPGLYIMYTYMIKQRRKVLGSRTSNHSKSMKVT